MVFILKPKGGSFRFKSAAASWHRRCQEEQSSEELSFTQIWFANKFDNSVIKITIIITYMQSVSFILKIIRQSAKLSPTLSITC